MITCQDCKHFQSRNDGTTWCAIELPHWLKAAIEKLDPNRDAFALNGCDLGKKASD